MPYPPSLNDRLLTRDEPGELMTLSFQSNIYPMSTSYHRGLSSCFLLRKLNLVQAQLNLLFQCDYLDKIG